MDYLVLFVLFVVLGLDIIRVDVLDHDLLGVVERRGLKDAHGGDWLRFDLFEVMPLGDDKRLFGLG